MATPWRSGHDHHGVSTQVVVPGLVPGTHADVHLWPSQEAVGRRLAKLRGWP